MESVSLSSSPSRIGNPSFSNLRCSFLSNLRLPLPPRRLQFQPLAATRHRHDYDVVVVGAGIIGLSIARHLLLHSPLSVAVADASVPCSGATGAGQGYIWMAHRTPGSDTWQLAVRSKQLWEEMVEEVERNGGDASELLGWKRTGSLLVGRDSEELCTLEKMSEILPQAGVRAEYLSASSLHSVEPELHVGEDGGALLLPDDCQLDAFQTVSFIEKVNNSFSSEGRYAHYYNEPVVSLMRSDRTGIVEVVRTSKNVLCARKAIVIAAGALTRSLLQNLNIELDVPVKPRKGHLLVLENYSKIGLNHGLMEVGYCNHKVTTLKGKSSEAIDDEHKTSISMTATIDVKGNLVLGSSRQFIGFSREVDHSIVKLILDRAREFLPGLRDVSLDLIQNKQIRIGHRPYMPDGKPAIGFVPGLPNVLLAAGHEGSGLVLALGTAEMITDIILGKSGKVDFTPFSTERFSG